MEGALAQLLDLATSVPGTSYADTERPETEHKHEQRGGAGDEKHGPVSSDREPVQVETDRVATRVDDGERDNHHREHEHQTDEHHAAILPVPALDC